MASSTSSYIVLCFVVVIFATIFVPTDAKLTTTFDGCPQAFTIINSMVELEILREPLSGAALLRLHFLDCFVNGCDGSILLADTDNFIGERSAAFPRNSLRGFEAVDRIRNAVNRICLRKKVSRADILAVAARDSVVALGGQSYDVEVGRKDAETASWEDANTKLPKPDYNLAKLLEVFESKGLNLQDLIVLSAAHTIGEAHCISFRERIHTDPNMDENFADGLEKLCPPRGSVTIKVGLDGSPIDFDNAYFSGLLARRGLLGSDQELFKNDSSDSDNLVRRYSTSPESFMSDFGDSMIRMGKLEPPPGAKTEVRRVCSRIN